jgi:hypothetical protein
MKTATTFILAFALIICSCKKEKKNEPAPASPSAPAPPTIDIEFFVNANEYEIREPFDHPTGSSQFTDLANPFSAIGTGDPCTTTGKKITVKYSTSDTTDCTFWFYTDGSPDTYRGTCDVKVLPTGNILLTYANVPGSSITPYQATCKKAIALN